MSRRKGANLEKRIAAELSWSQTTDRKARTRPAREAFLARFERQVDPGGSLSPDERKLRAKHAMRAHMLQLARRSAALRKKC